MFPSLQGTLHAHTSSCCDFKQHSSSKCNDSHHGNFIFSVPKMKLFLREKDLWTLHVPSRFLSGVVAAEVWRRYITRRYKRMSLCSTQPQTLCCKTEGPGFQSIFRNSCTIWALWVCKRLSLIQERADYLCFLQKISVSLGVFASIRAMEQQSHLSSSVCKKWWVWCWCVTDETDEPDKCLSTGPKKQNVASSQTSYIFLAAHPCDRWSCSVWRRHFLQVCALLKRRGLDAPRAAGSSLRCWQDVST